MVSRGLIALHAALVIAAASFATKTANATDCTTDAQCAGTRTPKCLLAYGICGCENDSQCGDATSGLICTGSSPIIGLPPFCTAGCGSAANRNKCAAGETCNAPSGGTGSCGQDCLLSGTVCVGKAVLNKCTLLTGGTLTQCAECTANTPADCASKIGAEVCSTTTNRCIQCNDDTNCAGKPNGQKCRAPDQSCGCNTDSDCITGRACNTTIHACLLACRVGVDGGATCAPGTQCNVTDGGPGQCVPSGDGGVVGDGGSNGDGGNRPDGSAGDGGTNGDENDGNYETAVEGGGWSCSVPPVEDSLPIGGLVAVGGFFVFFTRRRAKNSQKNDSNKHV